MPSASLLNSVLTSLPLATTRGGILGSIPAALCEDGPVCPSESQQGLLSALVFLWFLWAACHENGKQLLRPVTAPSLRRTQSFRPRVGPLCSAFQWPDTTEDQLCDGKLYREPSILHYRSCPREFSSIQEPCKDSWSDRVGLPCLPLAACPLSYYKDWFAYITTWRKLPLGCWQFREAIMNASFFPSQLWGNRSQIEGN